MTKRGGEGMKIVCDCGNELRFIPGGDIEETEDDGVFVPKNSTCVYKLSDCKSYYEGYFLKKYVRADNILRTFDMDIFGIDIDTSNIHSGGNAENIAFKNKPDFIFDEDMYSEILKHNWRRTSLRMDIEAFISGIKDTCQKYQTG